MKQYEPCIQNNNNNNNNNNNKLKRIKKENNKRKRGGSGERDRVERERAFDFFFLLSLFSKIYGNWTVGFRLSKRQILSTH